MPQQTSNKKRNYSISFVQNFSTQSNESFHINFTEYSPMITKDSSCPLLSNPGSIILFAPDKDSKDQWIERIQDHIVSINPRSNLSLRGSGLLTRSNGTKKIEANDPPSLPFNTRVHSVASEEYERIILSPLCCQASPSLVKLLWAFLRPLIFSASAKYVAEGKPGEKNITFDQFYHINNKCKNNNIIFYYRGT